VKSGKFCYDDDDDDVTSGPEPCDLSNSESRRKFIECMV
jgi:hypothetical protein